MRELRDVKDRILDRALYLFGKNSSFNVPVRTIIKEANVNIGAVNYYFGNKENMILKVKEFYVNNIFKAYEALDNERLSAKEKIIECSKEIVEYSIRYPGILIMNKKALDSELKDEFDIRIIESLTIVNKKLDNVFRELIEDEEELIIKKSMFMSSILYPFRNDSYDNFSNQIKSSEEKRIQYIESVINILLK